VAVLDARFRLYNAHSRIGRSGSSIAFPVVNKLPLEHLAVVLVHEVSWLDESLLRRSQEEDR
jgi:hypothetical protein